MPKALLRESGLSRGDEVEVRFRIGDQDAVDVPTELDLALSDDDGARRAWDATSPGKRRGMTHHVASAKRPATREARVETVMRALRDGAAWPPRRP